ncbi:uncharacterized protein [Macaca nemestrina]|uniref:uncharacterized protein isoform X1 n=1 Tax=Macaca nemestrina TaxID=9545 RepID=UPI0039B8BB07
MRVHAADPEAGQVTRCRGVGNTWREASPGAHQPNQPGPATRSASDVNATHGRCVGYVVEVTAEASGYCSFGAREAGKQLALPTQGASDICTAHTAEFKSPLLRCPSDVDKFLLCEPMRSDDCESIMGPPKDSGKCGPGWPVCADLHLQVRLEGNFWRVGWN